ncbi:MAG: lysylphosphatidylglycerol synthase transmembrane domain-containing protein [Myxococcota bacterium]|nr:lysylphosphatidylglycerol synthase transmembrane domain-containing protein [Myxococcota bacterium]
MGFALIGLAAAAFAAVTWYAWTGHLGMVALASLLVAGVTYFLGRRKIGADTRKRIDMVAKILFTIVGCMALLRHPIPVGESGEELPIYDAISEYITQVDATTFFTFAVVAMVVKFVGVISSAFAWNLLLKGQGVRYPFWSKIMTAFLIGRFIGTFLPSTIGLDGYTLYEAGRYSNQWARVITAKALEKFIGVAGLFLGMVLTLPFGYQVLVDVADDKAPILAAIIGSVAGGVCLVVIIGLVWPVFIVGIMRIIEKIAGGIVGFIPPLKKVSDKVLGMLSDFTNSVGAYKGQAGLLFSALFMKFITHFTTAAVYFFTALAIGVTTAKFWPITFGSTIQILATLFSPTIAGEGAREAFQALLLSNQLGGTAQAVLSGALGFIAAEAATMWGGAFLWTRKPGWRPRFAEVDGAQVDYAWINDDEDGGFDADKIAKIRAEEAAKARESKEG